MRLTALLFASTALVATPALADVTADDVWSVYSDMATRLGVQIVATTDRTGDALNVTGGQAIITYPMGMGEARIDLPDHSYTENGDGTVTVNWPDSYTLSVVADVPDAADAFVGAIELTTAGFTSLVSGDPDDMTATTSSDGGSLTVMPRAANADDLSFTMDMTLGAYDSTTRIQTGDLMTVTSEIQQTPTEVSYTISGEAIEMTSTNQAIYGNFDSSSVLVLPRNASLMDLTPALRDGLSITTTATYDRTEVSGETVFGDVTQTTRQTTGLNTGSLRFDLAGFDLRAAVADVDFMMAGMPEMPLPIAVTATSADIAYLIPVAADEAPQDFGLVLAMNDLEIDDSLWAIFDPAGSLPRTPADLRIDVTGQATLGQDMLDMAQWMTMAPDQAPDVALNALTVNAFDLAALDGAVETTGNFSFDMTDMTTFPGFPRPEGQGRVTLTNAAGVLAALQAAGLIQTDAVQGATMALGMFARPVSDDQVATEVEVNADGHVLVNGVRMR